MVALPLITLPPTGVWLQSLSGHFLIFNDCRQNYRIICPVTAYSDALIDGGTDRGEKPILNLIVFVLVFVLVKDVAARSAPVGL